MENLNYFVPVALSPAEKKYFRTDIKEYEKKGYTREAAAAAVKSDWVGRGACRPDMFSPFELQQNKEEPDGTTAAPAPEFPTKNKGYADRKKHAVDLTIHPEVWEGVEIKKVEDVREIIPVVIDRYNEELGLSADYWRTKGKPQEWRGVLRRIGNTIFKTCPHILQNSDNIYNIDNILKAMNLYAELCEMVGLPAKRGDFLLFIGFDYDVLDRWEASLNPECHELCQKLARLEGDAVASAAEGNRINPVVGLARLNAFHGWTRKSEIKTAAVVASVSAASLPTFSSGGNAENP